MPNTAPSHLWYTVQQLSQHFGFCSLKNWNTPLEVCQLYFSVTQATEMPLEGHVANIYKAHKAHSNKSPIDKPQEFLEVVHFDIGHVNQERYLPLHYPCWSCHTVYLDISCKVITSWCHQGYFLWLISGYWCFPKASLYQFWFLMVPFLPLPSGKQFASSRLT